MELNIQTFKPKDIKTVTEFLTTNRLPVTDLMEDNVQLLLAHDGEDW